MVPEHLKDKPNGHHRLRKKDNCKTEVFQTNMDGIYLEINSDAEKMMD